eukprot:CAMPEP_0172383286 /NCGR_PEP_ID=MMETSP1061-20121228/1183_1 /TAXON_ID=37318 /ORGANISM="Pseudo-nitzschia pungens, Strain cf. pungens" /LENGTH=332 /DNA_ID=CAMNT_0013111475 /DNA_START=169 /DNA_END=1167 /DNA_ORIENTATION=-
MNLSSSVLCALIAAGAMFTAAFAMPQRAIVGGVTSKPGDFPYFASFDTGCGGTLIAPDIVLTAAFCEVPFDEIVSVYIGAYEVHSTSQGAVKRRCVAWISDPDFDQTNLTSSNLALCKLDEPVTIDDSLVSVELNADDSFPLAGTDAIVMGLGSELPIDPLSDEVGESYSGILKNITLPIIDNAQCLTQITEAFATYVAETGVDIGIEIDVGQQNICIVSAAGGEGICVKDEGAPVVVRNYMGDGTFKDTIVGLVSWRYGCALPNVPSVNARVSSRYNWIKTSACVALDSVGPMCNPPTDAPTKPSKKTKKSKKKTKKPKKPKKKKSPKNRV